MKLFVDHCVSKRTVDHLRQMGHDVITAKDLGSEGALDPDILEVATRIDRVMVTEDRGFGDVRKYPPSRYQGLLVLKLRNPASRIHLHRNLGAFLAATERDAIRGCLVLVDETRVRVRRSGGVGRVEKGEA
jgi:predicted nuclease of predicted toxin-antitoxin system